MGRRKTIADQDLLAAARRVFEEHGHTATTRDVARAAGISQAVLYQRFASKDDLFLSAMAPPLLDVAPWLGGLQPSTPKNAKAHVRRIGRNLVAYLEEFGPSLLHLATHPVLRPETMKKGHRRLGGDRTVSALRKHLGTLRGKGLLGRGLDTGACADALVMLAHGVVLHGLLLGETSGSTPAARFDAMFEVLWAGLRAEPRP
jgi:AcrR family transcriptional regulator